MKKKDILKQINFLADQEIPDVRHKINLDQISIEPEAIKTPKWRFTWPRALASSMTALVILFTGFILFTNLFNPETENPMPLASETEIAGFQTVSAASILTSFDVTELSYTESYVAEPLAMPSVLEDDIETINLYMNMAETMIGAEDQAIYETIESDRDGFAYSFQYKSVDLTGRLIEYTGYYNLIEEDGYTIEQGVLVHQERTLAYRSTYVVEEEKTLHSYRVWLNAQTYVQVRNISTDTTQAFRYQLYRNGQVQSENNVVISEVENRLRVNMQITNQQNHQIALTFERDHSLEDQQMLNVSYRYTVGENEQLGQFNVSVIEDAQTGTFQYQYAYNGETIVQNRMSKGTKTADEDDFTPGNQPVNTSPDNRPGGNQTPGNQDRPGSGPRNQRKTENDPYNEQMEM